MDITFIMIVLNGMPFVKHSLESIYDFSDEIIIIEGPVRNLNSGYYDKSGFSTDGTTEFLNNFKDPDSKIKLFRGYFKDKIDMQNLAIKNASFDWVWLIDSDEVYKTNDLTTVKEIIQLISEITKKKLTIIEKKSTPGDQFGIYANNGKIKKILNFKLYNFEDGLNKTIKWVKNNYKK